jgi:hypothetical protein
MLKAILAPQEFALIAFAANGAGKTFEATFIGLNGLNQIHF